MNTPVRWGHFFPPQHLTSADWDAAMRAAVPAIPLAGSERGDLEAFFSHTLGENQFGPDRWSLSPAKRLYYYLKPFLPRGLGILLRRRYRSVQQSGFPLQWPVEDRYVHFLFETVRQVLRSQSPSSLPYLHFWPHGHRFAFVLTHDVETAAGRDFVRELMALEEQYGFRSSFNFVPEGYPVDGALLEEVRERGFEVGVHGLKHDGKLFFSRRTFLQRAKRINRYLKEWNAVGFRSPFTHRNPEWMQALEVEYDLSFFDTDPYETMPGGTMNIWPFFLGRFVELPYTLVQDHTLMVILGEEAPRIWLEKVDFLEQHCGMALVNVHPDYLRRPQHLSIYEEFLRIMAQRGKPKMENGEWRTEWMGYWHALPREVARWWRARAEAEMVQQDGKWRVPGLPQACGGEVRLEGDMLQLRPASP